MQRPVRSCGSVMIRSNAREMSLHCRPRFASSRWLVCEATWARPRAYRTPRNIFDTMSKMSPAAVFRISFTRGFVALLAQFGRHYVDVESGAHPPAGIGGGAGTKMDADPTAGALEVVSVFPVDVVAERPARRQRDVTD